MKWELEVRSYSWLYYTCNEMSQVIEYNDLGKMYIKRISLSYKWERYKMKFFTI